MDKRLMLISLVIVSMLVLGCAQQQAPQVKGEQQEQQEQQLEEAQEEAEPVEVSEQETAPPEAEEEREPAAEEEPAPYNLEALPKVEQTKIKAIRTLLDNARKAEENYFFRYTAPGVAQTDVWVRGDLVKRSIIRADKVDIFNKYNMVYLNRATLDAKGYCETTKASCPDGKGPFTENFARRDNIKMPKDWLLELNNNFRWALDNKIGDQLYHIIDYNMEGKVIRVYVNNYKGWPARVEIYNGRTKVDSVITNTADSQYIYDDMDIGGVSDDDVTPG
ncbi:hypothetical protein JW898_03085 [Candidatus Woesearchaeota archaeon]|nr:hypothetical protein [Candidatus Woesearchaeota archaeon]